MASPEYDVRVCDDPDYIVYSAFGHEHLNYNCIRIFYTGEEICPDFNICDYGIGFEYLTFGDRYFRLPIMYEPFYLNDYKNMLVRPEALDPNRKFCSFVYSNPNANSMRTNFFARLSEYKQVASGGKILNNVGGPVANKLDFERQFKFSIAFENVRHNGYTTEKLMQSFAAGGIPVYWGDPKVSDMFNSKAFINVSDYSSIDEAIEYIKFVDQNDDEYLKLLREPAIRDEYKLEVIKASYSAFVKNIFDQDFPEVQRTTREMANAKYVEQTKRKAELYQMTDPAEKVKFKVKKMFRKIGLYRSD